jgi:hypothetical protein
VTNGTVDHGDEAFFFQEKVVTVTRDHQQQQEVIACVSSASLYSFSFPVRTTRDESIEDIAA